MSVVKLALFFIFVQGSVAHAVTAEEVYRGRFQPHIAGVKTKLEAQNLLQAKQPPTTICLRRYDRLFNDSELNIAVGLGYYDNRPGGNAVQDIIMEEEIAKALTAPCVVNQTVCAFKKQPSDGTDKVSSVYVKSIQGPDAKPRTIKIKMFHSAEHINDDVNRNGPTQTLRSDEVESAFRYALKNSDIIFYLGHSRDGGGPDFDPPRLLPNLHVDYEWYHQNKGDFRDYLAEVSSRSTPPKLLSLLSCSSAMHFARAVHATSPRAGLLLTLNIIGEGQMFEGLMTLINGVQKFKCETQLAADLNAVNIDKSKLNGQERSLLQFRGFPPP